MSSYQPQPEYGHSQLPDGTWTWDSRVPAGQWQPYRPPQYAAQGYGPQQIVSRRTMNPIETLIHVTLTILSGGLWGFVWWARVRSLRTVTTLPPRY